MNSMNSIAQTLLPSINWCNIIQCKCCLHMYLMKWYPFIMYSIWYLSNRNAVCMFSVLYPFIIYSILCPIKMQFTCFQCGIQWKCSLHVLNVVSNENPVYMFSMWYPFILQCTCTQQFCPMKIWCTCMQYYVHLECSVHWLIILSNQIHCCITYVFFNNVVVMTFMNVVLRS